MPGGVPKKKVYIDEGLFDQILNGDRDAFRELYELSYKPLYAFLVSLTQNSDDAQDILQDTYIQVYKNCHQYIKKGNPMAWLMTIARNLFLMKRRHESVHPTTNYDEMSNEIGLDHISSANNRLLLEKVFANISTEDRELIILHDVSGLTFKEIASIVDKPIGTVLARYNRSIKRLQKELL